MFAPRAHSRSSERLRRTSQAFWICLAASAALHLALVAELPGFALTIEPSAPPLTAEIVAVPPPSPPAPPPEAKPKPVAPKPAVRPQPAARPQAVEPAPPPSPSPAATPIISAQAPDEDAYAVPTETDEMADAEPVAQAESAPEPAPEPAESAVAEAPPEPLAAEPEALAEAQPEPPQTGTIRYEVYYGEDRFSIGRSVQTWTIDKKAYRLTSFSETTGLLGLFKPYQFAYVAEGKVEAGALKPEAFTVRRGRDGERQATALFDWANGELTFGRMGSARKARLTATSYDLLTLFYQLPRMALVPGRMEVSVTTGTKFNSYSLEVGVEEMLELPIGTMRTIPIKQVRKPGEESIEVWLAPEQRYLPVRIVFFDDDGKIAVEQVANQIAVGTLAADGR